MVRDIESGFVYESIKCNTEVEAFNLKFTWTINSLQNFEEKYGSVISETFSANPNKNPSWYLCMEVSSIPEYYRIYLNLFNGTKSHIRGNFKFSLLNDEGEITSEIKPTQNIDMSNHVGTEKFVQKSFLHNLASNSKVKILCEINYMMNNFEFPKDKNALTKIDIKNELHQNFKQLLETKRFSDVTITVGEKIFTAHKAILAARSSVFADMFEDKMMDSQRKNVIITDIDCDVFEEVLNYIYTSKTSRLEEMALNLLAAADKYSLNGLKSLCEHELSAKISPETSLTILIYADLHNAVSLKADAIKFINNNAIDIIKTEGWKRIKKSHPHLIIEAYKEFAIQANKKCKTCKEDK